MQTTNNVSRIRARSTTTAAAAAPAPGTIAMTLDDLEVAEGLLATAHSALGAEDASADGAQVTLGIAIDYLRNGMDRVRAIRAPTTKD